MKHKGYFLLFLVLVLSDQFTKQIFMTSFDLGHSVVINPYLSWTYLHNTGAAFSILSDGGFNWKNIPIRGVYFGFSLGYLVGSKNTSDI
jgi:signal peptidase II